MAVQVQLKLPEIYKCLCPECQEKIRQLVMTKMADDIVRKALEEKEE